MPDEIRRFVNGLVGDGRGGEGLICLVCIAAEKKPRGLHHHGAYRHRGHAMQHPSRAALCSFAVIPHATCSANSSVNWTNGWSTDRGPEICDGKLMTSELLEPKWHVRSLLKQTVNNLGP